MTGYTYTIGRVVDGVQLVDVRGPWQFDENDFRGRIVNPPIPQTPALIEGHIVDAGDEVRAVIAAEVAASEAIRKATPIPYDQPIETPALVLTSHDGGLGIAQAALDNGEIVTYTYHASPIPSPEVLRERFEKARDKRMANRAKALAGINGQLQQRIENLERLAGLRE
jgi:hypothetical protein